jgi:hypothetical protein
MFHVSQSVANGRRSGPIGSPATRPPPHPTEVFRLRERASQPRLAKPPSVIAQVEGSGTVAPVVVSMMMIEPSPEFDPENKY